MPSHLLSVTVRCQAKSPITRLKNAPLRCIDAFKTLHIRKHAPPVMLPPHSPEGIDQRIKLPGVAAGGAAAVQGFR